MLLVVAVAGCPAQKVAADQPYIAYPSAPIEEASTATGFTGELRERLAGRAGASAAPAAPAREPVEATVERIYR